MRQDVEPKGSLCLLLNGFLASFFKCVCPAALAEYRFKVQNYYNYTDNSGYSSVTKNYFKREMNIYLCKNASPSTNLYAYSYKGITFKDYFLKEFTERAHIVPKYYEINVPDFLIDANGYAVLDKRDYEMGGTFNDGWNEALSMWRLRLMYYAHLYKTKGAGYMASVTYDDLRRHAENENNAVPYNNSVNFAAVNTGKLFEINPNGTIADYSLIAEWYEPDGIQYSYDALYKMYMVPKNMDESASFPMGITRAHGDNKYFNPTSVVLLDNIAVNHSTTLTATAIKVGLHELVHAWNAVGAMGKDGTYCDKHNTYNSGENMTHCMFKCPHDSEAIKNMAFSERLIQRLMNVFTVTFQ
jgi:hypothetical protein